MASPTSDSCVVRAAAHRKYSSYIAKSESQTRNAVFGDHFVVFPANWPSFLAIKLVIVSCNRSGAIVGRSNREQAQQNRQRILDETDAIVRCGGAAAAGISEIMARVGMTQGAFYHHFASKDALISEACSAGFTQSVKNWTAKAFPKGRPLSGALKRLVTYYLSKKPVERSCPMVALGQDAAPHHASEALNDAYRDGVDQLFSTFVDIARTDPSCSLSQEQLRNAFVAMVGANMLARATGDKKWSTRLEQSLFNSHAEKVDTGNSDSAISGASDL
ncbi:TetR/AcrR family transcriptional regulator [Paraburkholderia sp. GAS348]|uniref:TetR/AcrR family transcriptional regulator n=1 Tax=Paraburkholderia sp. GAS348 TaxID=3035132 RepID=UPI003D22066C